MKKSQSIISYRGSYKEITPSKGSYSEWAKQMARGGRKDSPLISIKNGKGNMHHIGIVVDNIWKYQAIFEGLGGRTTFHGFADSYGAECMFIDFGNVYVELIKGTKKDNHLNKFITKYGEGLHHIAFIGKGKTKGALPDMYVSFNKPNEKNRILIEEVEFK